MLCMGDTFVKENSCLVARKVTDTVDLHLLIFRILDPYSPKNIAYDFSHVISY